MRLNANLAIDDSVRDSIANLTELFLKARGAGNPEELLAAENTITAFLDAEAAVTRGLLVGLFVKEYAERL